MDRRDPRHIVSLLHFRIWLSPQCEGYSQREPCISPHSGTQSPSVGKGRVVDALVAKSADIFVDENVEKATRLLLEKVLDARRPREGVMKHMI